MSWYCWGKPTSIKLPGEAVTRVLGNRNLYERVLQKVSAPRHSGHTLPHPKDGSAKIFPLSRTSGWSGKRPHSATTNTWSLWSPTMWTATERLMASGANFTVGRLSVQWPAAEYKLQRSKFEHCSCLKRFLLGPIWLHLNLFDTLSKCPYSKKKKCESNQKRRVRCFIQSLLKNLVFLHAQNWRHRGKRLSKSNTLLDYTSFIPWSHRHQLLGISFYDVMS